MLSGRSIHLISFTCLSGLIFHLCENLYLDGKYFLEEGMTTHYGILAWRIPMDRRAWQPTAMGSQRVGHNRATKHSTAYTYDIKLITAWTIFTFPTLGSQNQTSRSMQQPHESRAEEWRQVTAFSESQSSMVAKSREAETRCHGSILATTTFQWWNSPTSSHLFYLFSHLFYIISFLPSAIPTAALLTPDACGLCEPAGPPSLRAVGPRHPWLSSPHVLKEVYAEPLSFKVTLSWIMTAGKWQFSLHCGQPTRNSLTPEPRYI